VGLKVVLWWVTGPPATGQSEGKWHAVATTGTSKHIERAQHHKAYIWVLDLELRGNPRMVGIEPPRSPKRHGSQNRVLSKIGGKCHCINVTSQHLSFWLGCPGFHPDPPVSQLTENKKFTIEALAHLAHSLQIIWDLRTGRDTKSQKCKTEHSN
jgi:hypothetical protein